MRPPRVRHARVCALLLAAGRGAAGCGHSAQADHVRDPESQRDRDARDRPRLTPYVASPFRDPLPGMPPVIDNDVYSQTRAGMLSPAVAHARAYLYVPDSTGTTVTVISQRTHKIVRVLPVGYLSQHVVPSYDLKRLIVNSSAADRLTMIDPVRARKGRSVSVTRPYNLYFTPDGRRAVVMVEQHDTIRFSDPHTFRRIADVTPRGCRGPNHADFSGNGRFFVVTCEFSGELVKVSTLQHRVLGRASRRISAA